MFGYSFAAAGSPVRAGDHLQPRAAGAPLGAHGAGARVRGEARGGHDAQLHDR